MRLHRVEAAIEIRALCNYLLDLPVAVREEVATIVGRTEPSLRASLEDGSFVDEVGLQTGLDISRYLGVEFGELIKVR